MAIEIKLPDLGDGIESADVLSVLVSEGDTVEEEQNVIEIETDKASAEVPTTKAGKVQKIHVSEGDTINVGAVILTLEATAAEESGDKGGDEPAAKADDEAEDETEEAAEEAPADEEEAAADDAADQDETEEAEAETRQDEPAEEEPAPKSKPQSKPQPRRQPRPQRAAREDDDDSIPAGPAVRRFAREVGVSLSGVTGSGPGGRITRDDVLAAVRAADSGGVGVAEAEPKKESANLPAVSTSRVSTDSVSDTDKYGPIRVEKMSRIRKTISGQMTQSWTTIPRVTNFDDADVTELEAVRQRSKLDYQAAGIKLTTMPFLIKSIAIALRSNPFLNASLDTENEQIIYHDYVNIGIAVDTEKGLIVPSLRNVNRMPIAEIARGIQSIAEKARTGDFSIEDLRGSTFTVSNLGAIGGAYSTPIINPPEVAILLVGRSRKLPMYVDDELQPRMMMPLSISYDHRLVDGATAARFLNEVKALLQSPSRILLAP